LLLPPFLNPKTQDQKLKFLVDERRVTTTTRIRREKNNSLATFPYIPKLI